LANALAGVAELVATTGAPVAGFESFFKKKIKGETVPLALTPPQPATGSASMHSAARRRKFQFNFNRTDKYYKTDGRDGNF
jgi:hypothetical protein